MSQVVQDPRQEGRDAAERRAWQEAFDLLKTADAGGELGAEDLEVLAEAAMWTGRLTDAIEATERAFAAYVDEGNTQRAAMTAIQLAVEYRNKLQLSVSAGWHQRASRLLENEPESTVNGYLELQRGLIANGQGDFDKAL